MLNLRSFVIENNLIKYIIICIIYAINTKKLYLNELIQVVISYFFFHFAY